VATLGTATSQAHLELLFRYTSELVFCFDGDNAGRSAVWKAMDAAFPVLKDGRQIRIMLLPQGDDPDSCVRERGADKFTGLVESSQALSDYFFSSLALEFNLKEDEGRAQCANKAKPFLTKLPEGIFKNLMQARLQEISKEKSTKLSEIRHRPPKQKNSRPTLEQQALAMMVQNPSLIAVLEEKDIDWDGLVFKGADKFKSILQFLLVEKPASMSVLLELYRDHQDAFIINKLAAMKLDVPATGIEQEFSGALDKLLEQGIDARFNCLLAKVETGTADEQEKNEFQRLSMHGSRK
jgi:DNA primase